MYRVRPHLPGPGYGCMATADGMNIGDRADGRPQRRLTWLPNPACPGRREHQPARLAGDGGLKVLRWHIAGAHLRSRAPRRTAGQPVADRRGIMAEAMSMTAAIVAIVTKTRCTAEASAAGSG
ncbi:hypothetical protein NG2371_03694 [Nocardia gamkensis]|nr:hypothetical protein [Nocardia gamkensis]